MKKLILLFAIVVTYSLSWSQNDTVINSFNTESVLENRVNSFYLEIGGKGILGSINYERVLPFSGNQGISLGVSGGFLIDLAGDVSYIIGKGNHFAQIGVAYSVPNHLLIPHIGYRYQANSGFLLKAGPMYFASLQPPSFGDFFWFGISLGYSFRSFGLKPAE
jgi:hypothetical protein